MAAFKGPWNTGADYQAGDQCTHIGVLWVCSGSNTGQEPGFTSDVWTQIASSILTASVLIAAADVVQLADVPVLSVPPVGAGLIITPLGGNAQLVYNSTPYDSDNVAIQLNMGSDGTLPVAVFVPTSTGFWTATGNKTVVGGVTEQAARDDTDIEGQGLWISTGSNPTSGDSDVRINTLYTITPAS